ncbi:MAG: DUF4397 domain-containing protein [Caldilinea sp. CFX5]|nr:DUF4397 domain-containing protein [Caldilinea sp. CFX5]
MISANRQRFLLMRCVPYRFGRGLCFVLLFVLLLVLAGQSGSWVNAAPLNQTAPRGTIPPGGTLPPPAPPTVGTGFVRVLHLAPFDNDIADTAIDICTQAGAPVTGFTGLVYLEQSGYQPLPAGPYDWTVSTPGCGTGMLDLPPFTLQSGAALTLLIVGGGNQPLTSVLLVDRAGRTFFYLPIIVR